jgi:hypothetical protein
MSHSKKFFIAISACIVLVLTIFGFICYNNIYQNNINNAITPNEVIYSCSQNSDIIHEIIIYNEEKEIVAYYVGYYNVEIKNNLLTLIDNHTDNIVEIILEQGYSIDEILMTT